MESYGYKLTHDLSMDDFQSGDLYNYEECALSRLQFKDETHDNMLGEHPALISEGLDDEAAKLRHILNEDKTEATKEEVNLEKNIIHEKVKSGCDLTLPVMPVERPDNLDMSSFKGISLEESPSSSDTSICSSKAMPVLQQENNSTTQQFLPFFSNSNLLLQEDSSPEEFPGSPKKKKKKNKNGSKMDRGELCKDKKDHFYQPITLVLDGVVKIQTHKTLFRFIPRHDDELILDVADPICVARTGEDGWCDGINLRTGEEGCFPARYARIYSKETETKPGQCSQEYHLSRFRLYFLGSVETPLHKGNEVLCRAISKVLTARKIAHNVGQQPSECILEISDHGVKMIDLTKKDNLPKKDAVRKRVQKFLHGRIVQGNDHYFSLKNISFCGFHPASNRYFGFITKHPMDRRFACHVFSAGVGKDTRSIAEAMGNAFKKFYSEFLDFTNPTEDIYME